MTNQQQQQSYTCGPIERYIRDTPAYKTAHVQQRLKSGLLVDVRVVTYRGDTTRPDRVCQFVVDVVQLLELLPFAKCRAPRINVRVWFTPFKKQWCFTPDIGVCQVNSGVTHLDNRRAMRVEVYRRECGYKVLIHELLHAFQVHDLVPSTFDTQTDNDGEAVVESLALLLYLWMLSTSDEDAYDMLRNERVWMQSQVHELQTRRWTSSTNTRSYFLVKTGLLSTSVLPLFLQWLFSPHSQQHRTWTSLKRAALVALTSLHHSPPSTVQQQSCLSMRMTLYDLVLD